MPDNQMVEILKVGGVFSTPIVEITLTGSSGHETIYTLYPAIVIRRQDTLHFQLELGPDPEPEPLDREVALEAAKRILNDAGLGATDLINWDTD